MNTLKSGIEYIKELVLIVLVALLFTIFIISHNKIPTSSMVSTINEGDHVLTNMIPYYYRDPKYNEIVVFKRENGESWVKRVIGLPGDTIDIIDGMVYRNGEMIDESAYLAEGVTSELLGGEAITFPLVVPEDSYFLMGDNRFYSYDCRYIGPVKRSAIYGKAWLKIYPFNEIGPLK